jgi:deoxyribodipyrimidine photo-lyase
MSYGLVWFKRDLRLADHGALAAAARRGPVLCVAIVEPALWAQADGARQHYEFMLESARELHAELRRRARVQVDAAPAATQLDLGF